MQRDFSKYVNFTEILNLKFELAQEEEAEIINAKASNVYKILKVMLYHFGIVEERQKYNQKNFAKEMEDKLSTIAKKTEFTLQGIERRHENIQYKQIEYIDQFSELEAKFKALRTSFQDLKRIERETQNKNASINEFINEYLNMQTFVDLNFQRKIDQLCQQQLSLSRVQRVRGVE